MATKDRLVQPKLKVEVMNLLTLVGMMKADKDIPVHGLSLLFLPLELPKMC